MTKKQMSLFGDSMSEEQVLTRSELITEIVDTIHDQLWSSDEELILETAKLVGLDITAHPDGFGLFCKKY